MRKSLVLVTAVLFALSAPVMAKEKEKKEEGQSGLEHSMETRSESGQEHQKATEKQEQHATEAEETQGKGKGKDKGK
jgi:hypothetical protein